MGYPVGAARQDFGNALVMAINGQPQGRHRCSNLMLKHRVVATALISVLLEHLVYRSFPLLEVASETVKPMRNRIPNRIELNTTLDTNHIEQAALQRNERLLKPIIRVCRERALPLRCHPARNPFNNFLFGGSALLVRNTGEDLPREVQAGLKLSKGFETLKLQRQLFKCSQRLELRSGYGVSIGRSEFRETRTVGWVQSSSEPVEVITGGQSPRKRQAEKGQHQRSPVASQHTHHGPPHYPLTAFAGTALRLFGQFCVFFASPLCDPSQTEASLGTRRQPLSSAAARWRRYRPETRKFCDRQAKRCAARGGSSRSEDEMNKRSMLRKLRARNSESPRESRPRGSHLTAPPLQRPATNSRVAAQALTAVLALALIAGGAAALHRSDLAAQARTGHLGLSSTVFRERPDSNAMASRARTSGDHTAETASSLVLHRFGHAYRAYLEHDLDHARELLEEVHRLDRAFLPAATLLGRVAYFQQDYARATELLSRVLEDEPHHMDAAKWLVRGYLQSGEVEAAEEVVRTMREVSSEDPELLLLLAQTSFAAGRVDRAIAATEQALAFRTALAEAALQLAIVYRSAGVPEIGTRYLQTAAALSPIPVAHNPAYTADLPMSDLSMPDLPMPQISADEKR